MTQTPDAKQKIILATLEIIKTSGMRAVRHRAVAAQAGVSLGSTTYHFKDIEDLISSAFLFWHLREDVGENPYFQSIEKHFQNDTLENLSSEQLVKNITQDAKTYLQDQLINRLEDRKIELAFHNEALLNSKLSKLLKASWQKETKRVSTLYKALGSEHPELDAEATFALILQLERKLMLCQEQPFSTSDFNNAVDTLKRHLHLMITNIRATSQGK